MRHVRGTSRPDKPNPMFRSLVSMIRRHSRRKSCWQSEEDIRGNREGEDTAIRRPQKSVKHVWPFKRNGRPLNVVLVLVLFRPATRIGSM